MNNTLFKYYIYHSKNKLIKYIGKYNIHFIKCVSSKVSGFAGFEETTSNNWVRKQSEYFKL